MEIRFVSYELSFSLKEKGFNEPCLAHYGEKATMLILNKEPENNTNSGWNETGILENCTAPLYQQVVDWFREKHKITIYVSSFIDCASNYKEFYSGEVESDLFLPHEITTPQQDYDNLKADYYAAYDDAIKGAIQLLTRIEKETEKNIL